MLEVTAWVSETHWKVGFFFLSESHLNHQKHDSLESFFFLGPAARNVEKRRGTAACCRLGWQIFRTAEVQTSTLVCAGITFEICFGRLWPAMDLGISGIISPQKCIK